jgi:hypothetical protein
MRDSKKSQLAGILGAIGIAVLAFFLIFSLNSLQWPLAASLGKALASLPSPATIPDGVLEVSVASNLTVFPGPSANSKSVLTSSNTLQRIENLMGVQVDIYSGSGTTLIERNVTGVTGEWEGNLPPTTYSVKLLDWRLDNFTTSVQVVSNSVTKLDVTLNASSYVIQSSNIADPDFSGYAVSWGQIYALVDANQPVNGHSPVTYLDTAYSPFTPMSRIAISGVTPISIEASNQNNGSQWVQFTVSAPLDLGSIRAMSILALRTEYSVNTIAV